MRYGYVYDSLNQLVRVNDAVAQKTYVYTYSNGNILSKNEYAYTTGTLGAVVDTVLWSYSNSEWGDLLTNYNGIALAYDEIGNMTAIDETLLNWEGRQLQSIDGIAFYYYNADGQRTSKYTNDITTNYYYNGSILAGEKTGNNTIKYMYTL